MHGISEKFTEGKDGLNLILSSKKTCFDKNGVGYKCYILHNKDFNIPVFECKFLNKFGHLESFCFAKLRRSKENTS